MTKVSYERSREAWEGFDAKLRTLIETFPVKRVCDVGGGANPALPEEFVAGHGLDYTVLDVSKEELDKAPDGYAKVHADICAPALSLETEYDFIFTRMLVEHVRDGEVLHRNIHRILADGGIAFHFFPTLYSLPFLANRMLPENLTGRLLDLFAPRDRHRQAKFPARYSWCRGPSKSRIRKLERLGYEVVEYTGFFGNEGYYNRIPPLRFLSARFAGIMLKHPVPLLTSYAYLVLRKSPRSGRESAAPVKERKPT